MVTIRLYGHLLLRLRSDRTDDNGSGVELNLFEMAIYSPVVTPFG